MTNEFPRSSNVQAAISTHRRPWTAWTSALTILLAAGSVTPAFADDPDIRVTPSKIEFGKVDGTKTKRVMIQNKGKAELVVSLIGLCPLTSSEFSLLPSSANVAPKKKTNLEVSYTPTDAGSDQGCLTVFSNDPDVPQVEIALSGSAKTETPGANSLRLRPTSIDFGEVGIGGSSTIPFRVQSQGQTLPGVLVNRCFETSDEFTFEPTVSFEVAPDKPPQVAVTYSPVNTGDDQGCLEVRSGNPDDEAVVLRVRGTGVETVDSVDLDIHDFKVKNRARVDLGQKIKVQLWVKNPGTVDEPRTARVIGEQNGETVYEEDLQVQDRVGNQGVTKYTFPSFEPLEVGDILWTATIDDDDPDLDQRLAVTSATVKPTESTGVDLDVRRFSVTRSVALGQGDVRIRLKVLNNGTVDETRIATVVGMQDAVEVYAETLSVSDSVGNRGSTLHKFPSYQPVVPGDILWMVMLDDDDDDDVDEAMALTRVTER